MFEQELEMERKSSTWGPLILVIVLVGGIVGVIGYYVAGMRALSQAEATAILEPQLNTKTPAVSFEAGRVNMSMGEDPQYKVLERAGLLKITDANPKDKKSTTKIVEVTDAGDKMFSAVKGFSKKKNADDTTTYVIPVATRKLLKVDEITMNHPGDATVAYEWQWVPNEVGNLLDLDNDSLKALKTWDRQKLIDKYGAEFYHAAPKKETVRLKKGDKGWGFGSD